MVVKFGSLFIAVCLAMTRYASDKRFEGNLISRSESPVEPTVRFLAAKVKHLKGYNLILSRNSLRKPAQTAPVRTIDQQ